MLLSDLLRRYGRNADTVTSGMHEAMASYAWPGNVRELFAFFESYLILLEGRQKNEKLFLELLRDWTEEGKSSAAQGRAEHQQTSGDLKTQLRRARQEIVRETVQNCAWNKSLAASLLGISYNTLWRILGENNGRRQAP